MEKKSNDRLQQLPREDPKTAEVSWKLDDDDKRFLRSMNVRPD